MIYAMSIKAFLSTIKSSAFVTISNNVCRLFLIDRRESLSICVFKTFFFETRYIFFDSTSTCDFMISISSNKNDVRSLNLQRKCWKSMTSWSLNRESSMMRSRMSLHEVMTFWRTTLNRDWLILSISLWDIFFLMLSIWENESFSSSSMSTWDASTIVV